MAPSLSKAITNYRDASLRLADARWQRNNYRSNFERDERAAELAHCTRMVCIALDRLWDAQGKQNA